MIAVKNQSYASLLFAILFLGAQLGRAFNSASLAYPLADAFDGADNGSFLQTRILDSGIPCTNTVCQAAGSINSQSYFQYQINFSPVSQITITINDFGKARYNLDISLSSTNAVQMQTVISISSSGLLDTENFSSWSESVTIPSSSFSSRRLTIKIQNQSPYSTISTLSITVLNNDQGNSSSFSISSSSSWGSAVGGVVGAVVLIAVIMGICICIRRRRLMRRLARRQQRSRAAHEVQVFEIENQPQPPVQQPQQPAQFPPQYQAQFQYQGQFQAPIMYQPINPNSPQQNIQFQPALQLVQVPGQDYQYYQGYQLAPAMQPMQFIMPNPENPDEGPLSQMNFDHRFPEAPLQNFVSSFQQKTCSICLVDLETNQSCRQLYCEHIFHSECAKVWLLNQMTKQNHGFCPNCNQNMTFVVERAKP